MRILLPVFILLLFFSGRKANPDNGNVYTDDFHILVQSLRELDPMLYNVMGKDTFDARVKRVDARLEKVSTVYEAIYIMQEFMYGLGDSHAAITSSYGYLGVDKILPFKVFILDKRIFVKECPTHPELVGEEILSIDNVASTKLIDSLKIFYPNDGRRDIIGFGLGALFNSLHAAFCHQSDVYQLETATGTVRVNACKKGDADYDHLVAYSWMDYTVSDSSFKCEVTDKYGYFRFSNFARVEEGHKVEEEFKNLLLQLNEKKIQNMVIDLRFNSGGDPYIAGRMATHFTNQPFRIFERLMLTGTRRTTYASYMVRNFSYRFRHIGTRKIDSRRQKVYFEPGLNEYKPSPLHFDGNVYVITASMTGSSATMLCKYLQYLPNVKFVGTETEGATNYFCAHRHCELTLPNTHIYVNFGMQIVELERGSSDTQLPTGIIPANSVNYSIEDLLLRKDKEMEWVRTDISSQK